MSAPTLEAIRYTRGNLQILNQLLLPHKTVFEPVLGVEDGHACIKSMKVRGAPAIAIVAALSLAVELSRIGSFPSQIAARDYIINGLERLKTSRPTAVNLFDAAAKLEKLAREEAEKPEGKVVETFIEAAEKMLEDDVKDNKNIGKYGAEFILKNVENREIKVLTHCNTGSLATAGYGTALGIIRALNSQGALSHAFCTETRPYNQGSRLTAYELVYEGVPATLVCDSMASALMRSEPNLAAIVVGADRVAANGDTANKIGTYQLAIAAKHHGVMFLVAAPSTSVDLTIASGKDIVIEERPAKEVSEIRGLLGGEDATVQVAAPGIGVWNPSFDVTPAELITAIVTEKGVVTKNEKGEFDMGQFLGAH
ncbi:uncharacterized protein VTP21DRAFT_5083 [Calcarisporiella thermophila]|uniref:uncharacterized protein n=1 Tax=Calcarisporiella thermophila TaxID=911321 RepID=UPI0037445E18